MRPRIAVAALVLFVLAAVSARRVTFDSDLQRLLPDRDADLELAAGLLRRVAVIDIEGDADDAARFTGRIGRSYEVRRTPTEREALDLVDCLRERAPRLIDDYAAVESRLADIPARLQRLARRIQEPDGMHLARYAAIDPLGIGELALEPLGAITRGLPGARFDEHGLVSADGRHRLVLVDPGFPPSEIEQTRVLLDTIGEAGRGLRVRHLGAHRSTYENATIIRVDATRSGIVGSLLVLAIMFLVFRRWSIAWIAVLPAVFGATTALGIYALFESRVASAVAGFSAALLGITIDYAIHISYSTRVPIRAILVGTTTTAAAFLCLLASSVPGLRHAGILGALGVLLAAAFALGVLRPKGGTRRIHLRAVTDFLQRPRLLAILALPLVVLAIGLPRVRSERDVLAMSRLTEEGQADEDAIHDVWGEAFRSTIVLVRGETLEETLQRNDAVLERLEGRPAVSLAGLLPSRRTQERRLEAWKAFWSGERVETVRREIARGTEGTPFREDAFEPFFEWVRSTPPVVGLDDIPEALWRDRLQQTPTGWMATTPVFDRELTRVEDATVVNPSAIVARIASAVTREVATLGVAAFLVVAVVVGLWFGQLRPALIVLASLAVACALTLGILGWADVPVSLANASFIVFLFGLGVDYAVFMVEARLHRARTGEDRIAESDGAVLVCALTTCTGFGALALASHPVLRSIGVTAVAGVGSAAVLTQLLVPRLWRARPPARTVADLFRDQGPVLSRYAAGKARRDPVVEAAAALGPVREVLVAGCGYGVVAGRILLEHPAQLLRGIDLDPRKVTVASQALRRFPNASFRCADLRTADLGRPDLVFLLDVLHYWSEANQERVLAAVVDALEPGGELVFRDGCRDRAGHASVRRREAIALRIGFTRGHDGLHFRDARGWHTLLEGAGLTVRSTVDMPGSGGNIVFRCRKPKR